MLKVLRPHQWVKNLLVFVPLVTSHRLFDAASLPPAFLAFLAFSLCASGVYVINDALDVEADRQHPRKKNRPFASGELPLSMAVVLVPLLLLSAFTLAVFALSGGFALVLLLYLATTTAYSIWLKREPVLDVILLSGLYTLRLLAGGVAVGISVSAWLLSFSLFLFLSLALMKRFSELQLVANGQGKVVRRGYRSDDMAWLQAAGFASAYLTVLVLALYINSDDVRVLYRRPEMLWGLCPLAMYWVTRLWFTAHRGRLNDDPIVAAATDPASYAVAVLGAFVLMAAL
jgi:4-hydroxybenzoate polyprenyltransferase